MWYLIRTAPDGSTMLDYDRRFVDPVKALIQAELMPVPGPGWTWHVEDGKGRVLTPEEVL